MKVRFVELTVPARTPRLLAATTPVAKFEGEGGATLTVDLAHVTPFTDVAQRLAIAGLGIRLELLYGACEAVKEAPLVDDGRLDLAHRFAVRSDDEDQPGWTLAGFETVRRVDLKILKHVIGGGEDDPTWARAYWSERLGTAVDENAVAAALEAEGCFGWRAAVSGDPEEEAPFGPYHGLDEMAFARCVRALAPLRERWLERVTRAVRAAARMDTARHAHVGTEASEVMHFLDDAAIVAIANGPRARMKLLTSFGVLRSGETGLPARALRKRYAKVVEDSVSEPAVHLAERWGLRNP